MKQLQGGVTWQLQGSAHHWHQPAGLRGEFPVNGKGVLLSRGDLFFFNLGIFVFFLHWGELVPHFWMQKLLYGSLFLVVYKSCGW